MLVTSVRPESSLMFRPSPKDNAAMLSSPRLSREPPDHSARLERLVVLETDLRLLRPCPCSALDMTVSGTDNTDLSDRGETALKENLSDPEGDLPNEEWLWDNEPCPLMLAATRDVILGERSAKKIKKRLLQKMPCSKKY